jgi:UDP-N-acetylmuramate--alanine ligase
MAGYPLKPAAQACVQFQGVGRRFELRGEAHGVAVIDDYAHHPTEIRSTLAAARIRYPGRRVWAVWQPHTYSRIRTLLPEFASAFGDADRVLVTEVFAARENAPQDGFSGKQIAAAVSSSARMVRFATTLADAAALLISELQPGDVVLVLSAGDADRISAQVLADLSGKPAEPKQNVEGYAGEQDA